MRFAGLYTFSNPILQMTALRNGGSERGENPMSFMEAVKNVFNNYANFSGRARRSEFWYFFLFNFLVSMVLTILQRATGAGFFGVLSGLYSLAVLVPGLAVGWRRMHDIGKSGAWYLIGLIPIVGTILIIIWAATDSQPGSNDFGPNPKGM